MMTNDVYIHALTLFVESVVSHSREPRGVGDMAFVDSPSYAGGWLNFPQTDSDVFGLFGNHRISANAIMLDDVYRPLSKLGVEVSLTALDVYLSEFSISVVDPPIQQFEEIDDLRDAYEPIITQMLITGQYVEHSVRLRAEYHRTLHESFVCTSSVMLSSSVFCAINIMYIDGALFPNGASCLSRKLLEILENGFVPVVWCGSHDQGHPLVFKDKIE